MPFNTFGRGPLISANNLYNLDSGGRARVFTFRTGDSNQTLSHDLVTEDFALVEGKTVYSVGYRIICNSMYLNNGTIDNNGRNASGATAGLGAYAGSLAGGCSGGSGGSATLVYVAATNGGSSYAASLGGDGGNGQASVDNVGAAGGTITWENDINDKLGSIFQPIVLMSGYVFIRTGAAPTWTGTLYAINGGAGGGGGGGKGGIEGAYSGGGGGGGGGIIHIACAGDINLANGSFIRANGGNGGDGATFGFDTGGGGGGGGGGCIIISCNSLTMDSTCTISCNGGSPGAPGTGSGSPTNGDNGTIIIMTPNGIYKTTDEISGSDFAFPIP